MATKVTRKQAAKPQNSMEIPASSPAPRAQGGSGSAWKWAVAALLLGGALWFSRGRVAAVGSGPKVDLLLEGPVATRGTELGQVLGCRHVAMDSEGNLAWVFGGGDQMTVQKFSARGAFQGVYKARNKAESLNSVQSMAFGSDGSLWLCEKESGRIVHLDKGLRFLGAFLTDRKDLTGVAVDPDGSLWVAGRGARLDVFDAKGKLLRDFKGSAKAPINDAYRLAFNEEGDLAVISGYSDRENNGHISVYAKDGSVLSSFKLKGKVDEGSCIAWDKASGAVVTNVGGLRLYDKKGAAKGQAVIPDAPVGILVPGLAVGGNGSWLLDMTSQGLGGMLYRPVMEAEGATK